MNQDRDTSEDGEDEEAIYRDIFDNRIHYTHMDFEQIHALQNDRDPKTGIAYVNSHILLKALWKQVELCVCVTSARKEDKTLCTVSNDGQRQYAIPIDDCPLEKM